MIHIIPFSKSTIDLTLKSNSILRHIFNAQYTIPFDACFGNRTKLPDDDEKTGFVLFIASIKSKFLEIREYVRICSNKFEYVRISSNMFEQAR